MRSLTTTLAIFVIGATTTINAQADAIKPATLAAPIEQCIRDNAGKVEATIPDLNQAVDFLVGDLCAQPIAARQAAQQAEMMQDYRKNLKDACAKHAAVSKSESKAASDKPAFDMCANLDVSGVGFLTEPNEDSNYTIFAAGGRPTDATALAAKLLLDLRLAHTKPGPKN